MEGFRRTMGAPETIKKTAREGVPHIYATAPISAEAELRAKQASAIRKQALEAVKQCKEYRSDLAKLPLEAKSDSRREEKIIATCTMLEKDLTQHINNIQGDIDNARGGDDAARLIEGFKAFYELSMKKYAACKQATSELEMMPLEVGKSNDLDEQLEIEKARNRNLKGKVGKLNEVELEKEERYRVKKKKEADMAAVKKLPEEKKARDMKNISDYITRENEFSVFEPFPVCEKVIKLGKKGSKISVYDIKIKLTETILVRNMMMPFCCALAITDDSNIYLSGGMHYGCFVDLDSLFKVAFHSGPENSQYIHLEARANMNSKRKNHAFVARNSKTLYAIGGKASNTAEYYSIEEDIWYNTVSLNESRDDHSACFFSNRYLFVFGGKTKMLANLSIEYLDCDIAEGVAGEWQTFKPLCKQWGGKAYPGCAQVTNKEILIFGGQEIIPGRKCEDEDKTDTCYIYNPLEQTLKLLPDRLPIKESFKPLFVVWHNSCLAVPSWNCILVYSAVRKKWIVADDVWHKHK